METTTNTTQYCFKVYVTIDGDVEKEFSRDMGALEAREMFLRLKTAGQTFICLKSIDNGRDYEEVTYKEIV